MPSKLAHTWESSGMSPTIGWVEGSWSWAYPYAFHELMKLVHASVQRVARLSATLDAYVANDSFSHRSSHQRMVTRSPNHMCAISCRITSARSCRAVSVTLDRNTNSSRNVTQPAFSIAPALNSGTNSWSYFSNG